MDLSSKDDPELVGIDVCQLEYELPGFVRVDNHLYPFPPVLDRLGLRRLREVSPQCHSRCRLQQTVPYLCGCGAFQRRRISENRIIIC